MHKVRVADELLDAAKARRPPPAPIFAEKTALLVIDMQNVFVAPGAPLEVPFARGIVGNLERLAGALRKAGGTVAWVTTTLPEKGSPRDWTYLTDFLPAERREVIRAAMRPGSPFHELWRELRPAPGDLTIVKDRFSPFSPGASNLDATLRAAGISHLIVTGTLTNVCCECTARDAMMLNYRVTIPQDANAARTDEDHLRGLETVAQLFAVVSDTEAVVAALGET